MSDRLFVATAQGIVTLGRKHDGSWGDESSALHAHRFTSVAVDPRGHRVLAGAEDGLFSGNGQGNTWHEAGQGLAERHVRWVALHPDQPGLAFAGAEPAALYLSDNEGSSWQARPEVPRLRERHGWFLPYSSEAGCVRGFAFHGPRGYAAVEVGGLLRSDDYGRSWALVGGSSGDPEPARSGQGQLHPDVHSVHVHPSSPDRVFAATGGGLYYSTDGGGTWTLLLRCYCRDVWVDPAIPAHLILGRADGVDTNGRIEESYDGGGDWHAVMTGLEPSWPDSMVERFVEAGDELLAVLSDGHLIAASHADLAWVEVLPALEGVAAAAYLPDR